MAVVAGAEDDGEDAHSQLAAAEVSVAGADSKRTIIAVVDVGESPV